MFKDEIYLSPKYKLEEYKDLFLELTPESEQTQWKTAIGIFRDRIEGRFFKIINSLLDQCKNDPSISNAFCIMSLNCLLIETLQQFYDGTDETVGKNEDAFVKFLMGSPYFNQQHKRYPIKEFGEGFNEDYSRSFYKNVRCGLLHQAQTKKNILLSYYGPHMVDVHTNPGWIMYDVRIFTTALSREFNRYIERLRDPVQREVRENFCKKWRYIVSKGVSLLEE